MTKTIVTAAAIVLLAGCAGVFPPSDGTRIRIKGSDSMLLLVQRWADAFMQEYPGIAITVEGGGSGSGIEALIKGTADIGASSRPLSADEVRLLATKYHSVGVSILGARDALGIIVHRSNPVENLTTEQVRKIFTGEITSWKEVGGYDAPIRLFSREPSSGTYLYFEEHVLLGLPYSSRSILVPGARAMVDSVAAHPDGFGYSTSVYAANVKLLSVNGFSHSMENVRNGIYPISRYLYLYTVHPPEGNMKKFVDWVVGSMGQRVARENGYIPLYDEPQ